MNNLEANVTSSINKSTHEDISMHSNFVETVFIFEFSPLILIGATSALRGASQANSAEVIIQVRLNTSHSLSLNVFSNSKVEY